MAIRASVAAGVTYVVAAGNDAVDVQKHIPANYPEVITVSAMVDTDGLPGGSGRRTLPSGRPDDTFAFFSNFGLPIDLAAPGMSVSSTYPGGLYATDSGTSYATPLVAGAAALYIATHPGAKPAKVQKALMARAEPGPIAGDPDSYPEGIVNVSGL